MPVLAEEVDAVIGGDTHRDSHALDMAAPTGATISTLEIANDPSGFAEAVEWIAGHAPGPRVIVGLEGTRSYGVGLSRALQAAGLLVVEVERPRRADRRRGKSDPIDAHLAALHVLRMPADRKTLPRSDGEREALRILLGARREMTTTVPWHLDLDVAGGFGEHRLRPGAVADVARSRAGRVVLFVAEVLGHLLVQRGLQDRLGQLLEQPIRTGQRQALFLGQPD